MSNLPPPPPMPPYGVPPQQPPYATPAYIGQPGDKPASITVLAVIGIVISALMLLCMPFSLVFMFVDLGMPNPVLDAMKSDPVMRAYSIVSTVFLLLLMIGLLFCSIGSLTLKPWARSGMVLICGIALAYTVIGQVVNLVWFQPKMEAVMRNAGAPSMGLMGGLAGTLISLLFYLPYPICVLYFFTRPRVKAAFDTAEARAV